MIRKLQVPETPYKFASMTANVHFKGFELENITPASPHNPLK
jgi:hypothetical protein